MKPDYQKALDTLYSFTDYEKLSGFVYSPERFDLGRVHGLLALLDNPHHSFKAVHVAGTKGKGSTSAMIASMLRAAGYRTALYTSPHLHTFRERIQLNGQLIDKGQVIAGVERLMRVAPQVPEITTFELITALAFDHFSREKAEWAVLEVGMGGRLDATNVVTPEVSVITPISYDHMAYLGDTLSAIAAEKSGIIKPGVPVVSAPQPAEAQAVIERIARDRGAPLALVEQEWQWQYLNVSVEVSPEMQRFTAWPKAHPSPKPVYTLPLLGRHQVVNAVTALATVDRLRDVPPRAVHAGLQSTRWPGRLQVLGRRPWVIVDGAHNGDSMRKLCATITELFPYRELILVFGVSAGHDPDPMLDALLPYADQVLVTQARHPRAEQPQALSERFAARGKQAKAIPIDRALGEALQLAGEEDLICTTGSLFLVADFSRAWFKHRLEPMPPSD